MCKATICFLMLLCSAIALGQQPQWTVVQNVVLSNQNEDIAKTTIFTPTEPGLYRLTLYFSTSGNGTTGWFLETLFGTDISGQDLSHLAIYQLECSTAAAYRPIPPITIRLRPNTPLAYSVDSYRSNSPCVYNLAITVEQLVQQ